MSARPLSFAIPNPPLPTPAPDPQLTFPPPPDEYVLKTIDYTLKILVGLIVEHGVISLELRQDLRAIQSKLRAKNIDPVFADLVGVKHKELPKLMECLNLASKKQRDATKAK